MTTPTHQKSPSRPPPYDAPLPARWGPGQRAKNTLIYWALRLVIGIWQMLPVRLCLEAGALLGWFASFLPIRERRRAAANLAASFPELSPRERMHILRDMYVHLGRSVMEAVHLRKTMRRHPELALSDEHRAIFDEALAGGSGLVAVTGHIGNWELLAQVLAQSGYDVSSIAKPLYDPRLTRIVHKERTASGLKLIWRGDSKGSKEMLRVFKNNGILGLLIDQDTRVQGVFVPFFGRAAHTPSAAAVLALRAKAPVVVGWLHRHTKSDNDKRAGQFTVHFEALPFEPSGDRDADVLALTAKITERLEWAIRQQPSQWVWMHDRWKTRPPA